MKKKIFNDSVYGFITIDDPLIFKIIEHPYFQRLRRIKQLGMTDMVYPGALHTRFHHAIGAMHLMSLALNRLISKGVSINRKNYSVCFRYMMIVCWLDIEDTLDTDIIASVSIQVCYLSAPGEPSYRYSLSFLMLKNCFEDWDHSIY